ncbi:hypothetical protein [Methanosarcina mazei]|uniref:Uncharacterized protein n=1 Tax=Methanosarcina mazei SarPi TaxID=1434115 RepID=A0A0E3RCT3_METMZ|nr:hypothetical protein [Methanosarcina mazei]AKB62323.1 hypothetical protein MSMAP_2338 [Methanosarcina mazei SarPi]
MGYGKSRTLFDSPTRLPDYRKKGVFLRPVDIEVLVHKNDAVPHNRCALFIQHENELLCSARNNVERYTKCKAIIYYFSVLKKAPNM